VFPNPFVDTLNISLSGSGGADGAVSVFVVDLLGRRIATVAESIRAGEVVKVTWNAADMPAGMYFTVVDDGSRYTVKPVIRSN
jgi:hypothetical protein